MKLFRSPAYRACFQHWPCVTCSAPSSEAAHVKGDFVGMGLQKPPDNHLVPLCTWCHRTGPEAQHNGNETAWWEARGIDPLLLAEQLYAIWTADPKDAQGIDEAIGMAHMAIEKHAWNAFKRVQEQFEHAASHEHAAEALGAYKIHLIATGAGQGYEGAVALMDEQMNAMLIEKETS